MFRIYPRYPGILQKDNLAAVTDAPTLENEDPHSDVVSDISIDTLYSAFSSPTAGLLMAWQYSGGTTKSADELDRLWTYIQDAHFNPTVDTTFSHDREKKRIEKYLTDSSNPFNTTHGWRRSSVSIPLPHERIKYTSENDLNLPWLTIDGVYHRDITDIIISAFQSQASLMFHDIPYEEYWQMSDNSEPMRVFGEAYSSPTFLDAYRSIHSLPREPGDDLERIVASIMLWSDATQLANFGDTSLWPIYLYLGNQSKYVRGKPTGDACHHVAYIPAVRDSLFSCQGAHLSSSYLIISKMNTASTMAKRHPAMFTHTANAT